MSNDGDTEGERFFRERYAKELQNKKNQPGAGSYSQSDEMAEERRNVSHQQGKTPGRRGEVQTRIDWVWIFWSVIMQ
jgi:hypothetical protein